MGAIRPNVVRWDGNEWTTVLTNAKRLLDDTGRFPTLSEAQEPLPIKRRHQLTYSHIQTYEEKFKAAFGAAAKAGVAPPAPSRQLAPTKGKIWTSVPPEQTKVLATEPTEVPDDDEDMESRVVNFIVNVVDRVCRHPAVVTGLHRLVQSAFEKEATSALDKTALWPEQSMTARLPRVLIVGLENKNQEVERAEKEFGKSLALRFWNRGSDSKGKLKQMLYGSDQVVVIPARVSHTEMQQVKSRAKSAPFYIHGQGSAEILRGMHTALENLVKQSIIEQGASK